MALAKVLLVGAMHAVTKPPFDTLQKRYNLACASSGKQAIIMAKSHQPHILILDALSLRTSGLRIIRQLRSALPDVHIIYIHHNDYGESTNPLADVNLTPPFTSRKLINSIERLLKTIGDQVIECGPFSMNITNRTLFAHGKEYQLTPKLATLVETFLRHPGQTIQREQLMEKVWDTKYMGDTRTLDVHIRWIRKALGEDAGHPRYLKTIRGVGYRFEIPLDLRQPLSP